MGMIRSRGLSFTNTSGSGKQSSLPTLREAERAWQIHGNKMAAVEARTCGSCCLKLKELVNSYEEELGLKGKEFDGTKSRYPIGGLLKLFFIHFDLLVFGEFRDC